MNEEIITIDKKDILYSFEVEDNLYYALIDSENPEDDNIYFALITKVDENNSVATSVPEQDMDKVIAEFEKHMDFFETEDELDTEEEEEYNG